MKLDVKAGWHLTGYLLLGACAAGVLAADNTWVSSINHEAIHDPAPWFSRDAENDFTETSTFTGPRADIALTSAPSRLSMSDLLNHLLFARPSGKWTLRAVSGEETKAATSRGNNDYYAPPNFSNAPAPTLALERAPSILFTAANAIGAPSSPKSSALPVPIPPIPFYLWEGFDGAHWDQTTAWFPHGVPNGQGVGVINTQTTFARTIQDIVGGVTVGLIAHDRVNGDVRWEIDADTPITLDQDGAGAQTAVIRNTNLSHGANNFLYINGTGLILADDLDVINLGHSTSDQGSIILAAAISGTGNITFNNNSNNPAAGQIGLYGANTFTGSSTIASGAVTFDNSASFGQSSNTLTLGSLGGGDATLVSIAGFSLPNNIVVTANSGGTLSLGGIREVGMTYSGGITLNGNVTLTSATTAFGTTARTVEFTNTIQGTGGVTIHGASPSVGFIALAGANTYSGGTVVDSGTLLIGNTTGSATGTGAVTVNNSGTLGGTGIINAGANNLTINGGGNITGGTNGAVASDGAVGKLTLATANVIFNGSSGNNATYIVDLNATTSDRLMIAGSLNLSSLFDQILFQGTATAEQYILATYTGTLTGVFDFANLPSGYTLDYGNPGVITLDATPVPEPATWLGGALALGAVGFTLRRRFARRPPFSSRGASWREWGERHRRLSGERSGS